MVKKEDVVDEQENDLMTKRKVIYLGYHKNFCWGLKINLRLTGVEAGTELGNNGKYTPVFVTVIKSVVFVACVVLHGTLHYKL